MRENDKKLSEASKKYIAMNERLTARLKIADANKAGLFCRMNRSLLPHK